MSGIPQAAVLAAAASAFTVGAILSVGPAATLATFQSDEARSGSRRFRGWLRRIAASALGRRVGRDRLLRLEAAAGAGWTVEEAVGVKVLGPLLAGAVALAAPGPLVLLAPPLALIAWRVPEFVFARLARRRVAEASREVPLFLDLLAVTSSAGLAPQLAVRLATEPLHGPLAQELREAIRRTDLGGRWRVELAGVADRLGLADLHRAAAVVGRSEAIGSSLADEVGRLAMDARESRRSRAAERARTAPVKMLFPLVFLILPAFLLLTVVPVLLSTVRSIG